MEILTNGMGLSVVVFFPLISAFLITLIPKAQEQLIKGFALGSSLVTFVISAVLLFQFDFRIGEESGTLIKTATPPSDSNSTNSCELWGGDLCTSNNNLKSNWDDIGRDVSFIHEGEETSGKIIDINQKGELIVEVSNQLKIISSGEITV